MTEPPETFDTISDASITALLSRAIGLASSLLGMKRPPMPLLVWHDGVLAETRIVGQPAVTHVLFVRGSTRYQLTRQAGHEAVHVLAGTNEHYWTHEMVAELMSLDFIRSERQFAYWATEKAGLERQARSEASMLKRPYNFGKCYQTGIELLAVMKRHQLLTLARYEPSAQGLEQWLADLPPGMAAQARTVISKVMAHEAAASASPAVGDATASGEDASI